MSVDQNDCLVAQPPPETLVEMHSFLAASWLGFQGGCCFVFEGVVLVLSCLVSVLASGKPQTLRISKPLY